MGDVPAPEATIESLQAIIDQLEQALASLSEENIILQRALNAMAVENENLRNSI